MQHYNITSFLLNKSGYSYRLKKDTHHHASYYIFISVMVGLCQAWFCYGQLWTELLLASGLGLVLFHPPWVYLWSICGLYLWANGKSWIFKHYIKGNSAITCNHLEYTVLTNVLCSGWLSKILKYLFAYILFDFILIVKCSWVWDLLTSLCSYVFDKS